MSQVPYRLRYAARLNRMEVRVINIQKPTNISSLNGLRQGKVDAVRGAERDKDQTRTLPETLNIVYCI